jgi:hypothetical protein
LYEYRVVGVNRTGVRKQHEIGKELHYEELWQLILHNKYY